MMSIGKIVHCLKCDLPYESFWVCPKCSVAIKGTSVGRLPRHVLEALEAAAEALEDLGACDDRGCRDENCNRALTKVRDVLAEQ